MEYLSHRCLHLLVGEVQCRVSLSLSSSEHHRRMIVIGWVLRGFLLACVSSLIFTCSMNRQTQQTLHLGWFNWDTRVSKIEPLIPSCSISKISFCCICTAFLPWRFRPDTVSPMLFSSDNTPKLYANAAWQLQNMGYHGLRISKCYSHIVTCCWHASCW